MKTELTQFLQLMALFLWNLFPNGTMLLATWFWDHTIALLPEEEDIDEFWIPHFG